jgi:hypothetical protein
MSHTECITHGKTSYALVCCHLAMQKPDDGAVNYYCGESEPGDERRTEAECVWCDACDAVLMREGDWNETAERHANVQVICASCLDEIKRKNIPGNTGRLLPASD